jgi:hypothetical protein
MKNVTPAPRRRFPWRTLAVLLPLAGVLVWWAGPLPDRPCRVLLPDGLILDLPRTWTYYVPEATHPDDRPSRLDLRGVQPPVSADRVPVGPPQRRLDSLLLVEITSSNRNATAAVYYDAHLDFDGIHGGLDLPGAAQALQQIYRQQVLDAHRGTAFRFEWDTPEISYRDGRTLYSQTYRRLPPDAAAGQAPAEYRLRVILRKNAAIRIESRRTPEEFEDPQIAIDLDRLWASLRPAS